MWCMKILCQSKNKFVCLDELVECFDKGIDFFYGVVEIQ